MRAIPALLRRTRAERGRLLLLNVLLLVTAFVFAAAPLLLGRALDDGLRHALTSAAPAERNVELSEFGHGTPGFGHGIDDGLAAVAARGEELEAGLPASVGALVEGREVVLDSVRFLVVDAPRPPSHLTLRHQSGVDDRLRFVEGRPPADELREVEIPGAVGPDGSPLRATAHQIALSTATADALGFSLGDRIYLAPEESGFSQTYAAADVVGLFEPVDADDEFWLGDTTLGDPVTILESVNVRRTLATALVAPASYEALLVAGLPVQHRWRYFLDVERLDAAGLDTLWRDVRRMSAEYATFVPNLPRGDVTSLRSGLVGLIEGYADRRLATEAVLMVAAVGPAALALLAVALVAVLVVEQRRRGLALVRWRGASVPQLLASELVTGLGLAGLAAALGYLLATVLVGGREGGVAGLFAGAVAGAAVLVLLVATALAVVTSARAPRREAVLRLGRRRLVAEALVVVLAVGGAALLRSRGLLAGGLAAESGTLDPLLAATPVLLGTAAGVVTVRLYPLPVRLLGHLAAARRDLVPVLALRGTARAPLSSHTPLLVLLLAIAIAAFSSVMLVTIERGQSATAWQRVGADFRIDVGPAGILPAVLDLSAIAGVEGVAPGYDDDARLAGRPFGGERIALRAIDAAAYEDVVVGTPADPALPGAMLGTPPSDVGSEEAPLPAIVSTGFEGLAGRAVETGDTVELAVAGDRLTALVVGRRASFPGIAAPTFAVVPYDWLRAALPDRELLPRVLFLRAGAEAEPALRAAVESSLPPARLASRPAEFAALRASPLVQAVDVGFALALATATAYALLGVAAALVLGSAGRAHDLARLRSLGLSRRQLGGLAVLEHAPPVLIALVGGTALGVGVAWLVLPALHLDALLGASASETPAIHPLMLSAVVLLVAAVAAAGMLATGWLVRRLALARAVRGDED